MSALMSKRQQARNEKALQDLVHNVPGNGYCADCQARNPSWASWNLGIFLCMRCASIHRKLGTHISKVKSLSMDSWTNDQVDNMKRVGNVASNKKYNPTNKKSPVPVDADEADSAVERFIRSKYMQNGVNAPRLQERDGTVSDEDTPPPLPPKTGSRFGFRTTSSTFPLSFKSKKGHDHPVSPRDAQSSTILKNKPSKIFGASVQHDSLDDTTRKLQQLRDMGFMDEKRNTMVLKGCNGNLEKTIESLVRLGEGGGISPGGLVSPRESSLATSRSHTPVPPVTPTASIPGVSPPNTRDSASQSNNPWDIPPAQPQSSQSTGTLQNKNPFYSTNPFGMPTQQAEFALNQSLQNLSLAPSQPLFPNHTGGIPAPQPPLQSIYQQSMTPPISQTQGFFNSNQTYPQPVQQPQQNHNPFLQAPTAQQPLALNTNAAQMQGVFGNNPFARSPTRIASPPLGQIPEQTQQNFYSPTQAQNQYGSNPFFSMQQQQPQQQQTFAQLAPQMTSSNPWQQQLQQQQPQQQFQQPIQYAPQVMPQQMYQPQRPDKASIMALYGMPHLAPQPTGYQQPTQDTAVPQSAGYLAVQPTSPQPQPQQQQPRSVSSPLPGTNNPFMATGMSSPPAAPAVVIPSAGVPTGARSRESMTLGMEMGWSNGRHSPDAFASLSARSR